MAISKGKESIRVTLPKHLIGFLNDLSKQSGSSKSEIIEQMIVTFVANSVKTIEKENLKS